MQSFYSPKEELANTITHAIGAFLSLIGLILLSFISYKSENMLHFITSLIYGISLICLYSSSALYHGLKNPKQKKLFRTFDHCSIFLLIAGSYTPFTLITLKGSIGLILFAIIWIFAILGIILNIIDIKKYDKLSLICYIAMGWAAIFAIKPLFSNLHISGFILLLAGGFCYTFGIIFYKKKNIQYMHAVWHIFVLLGSFFQFLTVLLYVI